MTSPQAGGVTPAYGLRYIVEGQPARYTRQYLEQNAKTIEAALLAGGVVPPGAADLNAVTARVAALETAVAPRLEVYRVTGGQFAGTYPVPYDGVRTAQSFPSLTANANAWFLNDTVGRRIQLKQAGLYHFEVAMATTVAEVGQFIRLCKMPTAATAGPTIGIQNIQYGYGRLVAEERIAAGEYVGVFLNSSGSDAADNPVAGNRNLFSIRRVSA